MNIKSEKTIYQLVTEYLSDADQPVTCNTLMEDAAIRREALAEYGGREKDVQLATNKLSDLLGFMWRRGVLTRYPAPRTSTSFARYAYMVTQVKEAEAKEIPPPHKLKQFGVLITEHEDGIAIELEKISIFIRPKK